MADRPDVHALAQRLARAGCVAATEEAAEIVAFAPDAATAEAWLGRRELGEPLAWITGRARFCGQLLEVAPGCYVPRPQSEELARRAAARLFAGGSAADLCTGTGAVAAHLAAAVPGALVVGTELDAKAAACARRNGVRVVRSDLDGGLRGGCFDLVTAVAPYVPSAELRFLPADVQRYEPRLALDGGADGLAVLRRVVAAAARLLRPRGWLLVEVGGEQDRPLRGLLEEGGFDRARPWHDADGDLRGVEAVRCADPSGVRPSRYPRR